MEIELRVTGDISDASSFKITPNGFNTNDPQYFDMISQTTSPIASVNDFIDFYAESDDHGDNQYNEDNPSYDYICMNQQRSPYQFRPQTDKTLVGISGGENRIVLAASRSEKPDVNISKHTDKPLNLSTTTIIPNSAQNEKSNSDQNVESTLHIDQTFVITNNDINNESKTQTKFYPIAPANAVTENQARDNESEGKLNQILSIPATRSASSASSFDFFNLQMSSDDEEYNDRERFRDFYGTDAASSTKASVFSNNHVTNFFTKPPIEYQMNACFGLSLEQKSNNCSNSYYSSFSDDRKSLASLPTDPPAYSEFDTQVLRLRSEKMADNSSSNSSVISRTTNQSLASKSRSKSGVLRGSPVKRAGSIGLKNHNNGELHRHTMVDFYSMDRYLPPYRSLINPNRVFDYRTNTFLDLHDNLIEFKKDEGNIPMVSISRKKSNAMIKSILLNNRTSRNCPIPVANNNRLSSTFPAIKSSSALQNEPAVCTRPDASLPKTESMDFPKNIQELVISKIDNQHDLVNCLYVSKSFLNYTIPHLYYYPKFSTSYRFAQFVHTILCHTDKYAKHVNIFDLSNIQIPVTLSDAEALKFKDELVFGNQSKDLLEIGSKTILATWRDWKFRNHRLYGDIHRFNKRSKSISIIPNSQSLQQITWECHLSNLSTQNLNESRRNTICSSTPPKLQHGKPTNRIKERAMPTTHKLNNHIDSKIKRSTLKDEDSKVLFKTLKRVFGIESNHTTPHSKVKSNKRRLSSAESCSLAGSKKTKESCRKLGTSPPKSISILSPFSTPHPKMNVLLRKHCFSKDVPIGYVIHILQECKNIKEVNFDNLTVGMDYELFDYESFSWFDGEGCLLEEADEPKVLDDTRLIYWSDTCRDMNLKNKKFVKAIEIGKIWDVLLKSEKIQVLKLKNLPSLEMKIVKGFIMDSRFKNQLQILDCSGSGMVKRNEWCRLKYVQDWRHYFVNNK